MNQRFAQLLNVAFMQYQKEQRMRTQVTADITPEPIRESKEMRQFDIGDFVLTEEGNVGIKIAYDKVRWLIGGHVGAKQNDQYSANFSISTSFDVPLRQRYLVPTAVHVNVKR